MGNLFVANKNANTTMVPQNNLSQDQGYCASYYYPYDQCVIQRGESSQTLVTQEQVVG